MLKSINTNMSNLFKSMLCAQACKSAQASVASSSSSRIRPSCNWHIDEVIWDLKHDTVQISWLLIRITLGNISSSGTVKGASSGARSSHRPPEPKSDLLHDSDCGVTKQFRDTERDAQNDAQNDAQRDAQNAAQNDAQSDTKWPKLSCFNNSLWLQTRLLTFNANILVVLHFGLPSTTHDPRVVLHSVGLQVSRRRTLKWHQILETDNANWKISKQLVATCYICLPSC